MGLIDWFKLISPLGWAMIIVSVILGVSLAYFLFKRFPNLFSKDKKLNKIINDPHLLLEKLKANGKIFDHREDGSRKEIIMNVEMGDDGKEIIAIKSIPRKIIKKEVKKKVEEKKGKPKKKTKKKGIKKWQK